MRATRRHRRFKQPSIPSPQGPQKKKTVVYPFDRNPCTNSSNVLTQPVTFVLIATKS